MSERLSLKVKLPIVVAATMTIVIVVLAGLAYREVRQAQFDIASERLLRVSNQLVALTANANQNRLTLYDSLADDPSVVSLVTSPGARGGADPTSSPPAVAAAVDSALAADAQFLAYRIVSADGSVVFRSADDPEPLEPALGPVSTVGEYVSWGGRLAFSMSVPIEAEGEQLGSLVVWRNTAQLNETTLQALQDLMGVRTGIYVGSPGTDWTDLRGRIDPPPAEAIARAGDDVPSMVDYEWHGARKFGVAAYIEGVPWILLVDLPAETVLAPAQSFLIQLLLLSPFAVLAVALSAWFLGITIARSLRETTLAAEAIAAGEEGHRVPVRGNDELGRLAGSFNSMAQQIEDTQRAMEDMNASLRTMLDGAPLPIIVLSNSSKVRMWNRAAERTFGWSREEVLSAPMPLRAMGDTPLELPEGRSGSEGVEARVRAKDDRILDLYIAAAPTYSATGRIDGRILACDDITARKRQEEQLARYAEKLARSNAELENFAYVASHDLREPLRMVRSFTGLLAERYADQLDEVGERYISFARGGAERMDDLIKALLEYSRVEGDREEAVPTDSGRALDAALEIMGPAIREHGASVTVDDMPEVVVNQSQLTRVFQNLISNAIKFSGETPPAVHISAVRRGDRWVFGVQDNGIGIEPVYHDRIFQIFKRLHGLDEYSGTGMGLSICKKIVEANGGAIWVDSNADQGACFYFTLPARAARVA
ncbi:MAG: HAMP domain-containing protein [Gemmatimonadetes bacterium]|nr:HAMP domain-containing protein [Gemmatimonadota bacterium]